MLILLSTANAVFLQLKQVKTIVKYRNHPNILKIGKLYKKYWVNENEIFIFQEILPLENAKAC